MITTLAIKAYLAATGAPGDAVEDPISLDSEDDDQPQVAEARLLPDARAHVRGGLYVANSAAGAGLFTSVAVPAGVLVGYFGGVWRTDSEYADLPAAQQRLLDQYAATVKPELDGLQPEAVVVAPPIAVGQQRPDLRRYPLAAANEPLVGQVANAAFQRVQLSVDDVIGRVLDHQMDGEFVGLAVYTCSAIGANREVLLHYGPDYQRARYGYQAGEPCELQEDTESPLALGRIPISELGIIEESVSDVSDDSDDSYDGTARGKRPIKRPTRKPKTRRIEGESSSGAGSSSEPPPAPPPPPQPVPPPVPPPAPQPGTPQLFGGSGSSKDAMPQLPQEFVNFHNRMAQSRGGTAVSVTELMFSRIRLADTGVAQKRPLQERISALTQLRTALVETDVEAAMNLINQAVAETRTLKGTERAAAEALVASAHEAAATMLEDQAAEGERVCVWDCESTELVQTGTHISDMEISVVSCLLLNINAALRNPEAEVRRAMKEDLYSFWNERSGRGAPLTLLGLLLGHTKHNVAYNANFDLSISKKHLTTDAYAHARQHNLDPFARLRSAYGTSHKLSHLLQSNGLPDKSGAGSEAPTLWRQRRLDELLKYNVGDVELLARLVLLKALRLPDGRQTAIGTLAAMLPAAPAKFSASDSRALAQGSPEWFAARKHKITASLAPALLGFGFLTREDAFEVLMGTGETEEETPAMRRGQALEPVAAEAYARRTGQTVAATGLWVDSSRPWLAASPDRLVGSHGLLEVKSPAKISEPSAAMVIQVQIQLLVTGRFWCDLLQYTVNGEQRVDRLFPDSSLVKLLLSYLEPIADAALEAVATGNEEGTFIPEMSIHEKRELRDEVKESLQSHRRRM